MYITTDPKSDFMQELGERSFGMENTLLHTYINSSETFRNDSHWKKCSYLKKKCVFMHNALETGIGFYIAVPHISFLLSIYLIMLNVLDSTL